MLINIFILRKQRENYAFAFSVNSSVTGSTQLEQQIQQLGHAQNI